MGSIRLVYDVPLLLLFSLTLLFVSLAETAGEPRAGNKNNTVSAVYVFGDSTVDPGNNNYISTIVRSNYPPYGKDFPNKKPTGRFSNGRLTTDFIASYLGVKEHMPPYFDPTLSKEDLMTGVTFASGGSGFDPLTAAVLNVIDMPEQLEYFKRYKKKLESEIGKDRMEEHIKKAVFVISAGTNDFMINYFSLPIRKANYTVIEYEEFVSNNAKEFIQGLLREGARRITVSGLAPMGCLPLVMTLKSEKPFLKRGCVERYSAVARHYNLILQYVLHSLQISSQNLGAKIRYIDTYTIAAEMIRDSRKYGLEKVDSACCGTGYMKFMCNKLSAVCADSSKYMFWDAIHPTEHVYYNMFESSKHIIDDIVKD